MEFVTTSITSGGYGADRRAGADRILANNPFLKFTGDRRGYAICDVTAERWQTQARIVRSVSTPDAPVDTLATFTVPAGEPALSIG